VKKKDAPPPSAFLAHIRPPCASMIVRLIDSPSPCPPLWVMRSRLTPRTPMADRVFEWLRAQA